MEIDPKLKALLQTMPTPKEVAEMICSTIPHTKVSIEALQSILHALKLEQERTGPECHTETNTAVELVENILSWAKK